MREDMPIFFCAKMRSRLWTIRWWNTQLLEQVVVRCRISRNRMRQSSAANTSFKSSFPGIAA